MIRFAKSSSVLVAAFAFGWVIACGGSDKPAESPKTDTSASASASASAPAAALSAAPSAAPAASSVAAPPPPPPPAKKAAKDIVLPDAGATFMFSLADSADAKKASDDSCAKKKDPKKVEACQKEVQTAADGEGVRFEKDAKGAWWWVSFGHDAKGKEVVYNKVQFDLKDSNDTSVTLTPKGKDSGTKPMAKLPATMQIDVADESTISITDPKKGKLVYKIKK